MTKIQEILKTELESRQKRNPHFSLRAFAKTLSVSPAQLSQIIGGKRPITVKFLEKITQSLDYSPSESENLFRLFAQGKNAKSKELKISKKQLDEDSFKLIATWHHLAILSLTKIKGAKSDPRWIANQIGISSTEAAQAIKLLERMDLISINGSFEQKGSPFEVISEAPSQAIRVYHKQNLNLASEKIETVPNELREFQSITIPIHSSNLKKYKELINNMMELASDIGKKQTPDQVYNLNVQFFPITQPKERQ